MQKEVNQILLNYLASHDSMVLPGVGSFTRQYRPAHFAGNQLKAPSSYFYFDADKTLKTKEESLSKVFSVFQWDEIHTYELIRQVFEEIRQELSQQKTYSYPGLGSFERTAARISFFPDPHQYMDAIGYGLESVLIQTVEINKEVESQPIVLHKPAVKVKSNNFWLKVAAAILLLMVTNFGVMYLLEQKGGQIQEAELGNFDSIPVEDPKATEVKPLDTTSTTIRDEVLPEKEVNKDKPTASSVTIPLTSTNFQIIVGAFRDSQNAEKYIDDLKKAGYNDVFSAGVTNSGLHRVAVAKFSSQEMAEAYLEEIKIKLQADAWIMN